MKRNGLFIVLLLQISSSIAQVPSLSTANSPTFGNACLNNTIGPRSFSINGVNLTNAPIVVGALTGFTFCLDSNGTYTSSLSIIQSGGNFSRSIFVKFTPTAIQSYSGVVNISGGGVTAPVQTLISGAGVNNTTLNTSTGPASNITSTTATLAGSVVFPFCGNFGTSLPYGFIYSTTPGFTSGTQVNSNNHTNGSFSATVTGLNQGVTYYYKAFASGARDSVITSYGNEQSFTTSSVAPSLSSSSLSNFGSVCINTTSGPKSFSITGNNLTAAPIVIGALAGFSYSADSSGIFSSSLSITQGGGNFSRVIFVKFTPTIVQTYADTITISGGGVNTSSRVFATGTGVNTLPITTGATTGISSTTAILSGLLGQGCATPSSYGIAYSTISGFGGGTMVSANNLSNGTYTVTLTGLTSGTTYYYKAYANDGASIRYGNELSFSTSAQTPSISTNAIGAFGSICINTIAGPKSFTITGSNLTNSPILVGAVPGFNYSTDSMGSYSSSLSISQTGGNFSRLVFVKFTPTIARVYADTITISGGGANTPSRVQVSGIGLNTLPTSNTGNYSSITPISCNVESSFTNSGCSNVTAYGVEWSTQPNFSTGTGAQVGASGAVNGMYIVQLIGLTPATNYFYRSYAVSANGTSYGNIRNFQTETTAGRLQSYPNVANQGSNVIISKTNISPGTYVIQLFNLRGQPLLQKQVNAQNGTIQEIVKLPLGVSPGLYYMSITSQRGPIGTTLIIIN